MPILRKPFHLVVQGMQTVMMLAAQMLRSVRLRLRARMALAAENLFLQQQLALYQAPNATWRRDLHTTRVTLVWLLYWFDWQPALTSCSVPSSGKGRGARWYTCLLPARPRIR